MRNVRWRSSLALVLGVVALVAVVRLPSFVHNLFDPDEAAIAAQAISVRDGGQLYVDAIDRKPPLPALVYAASFEVTGATDLRPIHLLAALCLAGAALVVAYDQRRRHSALAGVWAAGLFVCGAVGFMPSVAQAANYAHLALLPGTAAVVLARRGTRWSPTWAGLLFGLAVLSRQSWIIGLPAAGLSLWLAHGTERRERVRAGLGFGLAFALTLASVGLIAPFAQFWSWTFTGNESFLSSTGGLWPSFGRAVGSVSLFVVFHLTLSALLAVVARRTWRDRAAHRQDLDLWLWIATALVAVAAGFRFFGHYWLQVLAPTVLLAAPLAAELTPKLRRLAVLGLLAPTAVAVSFAWAPPWFRHLPDPDPVAAYVRANTAPGESVWVWGSFPELYLAADRPPGGALVHSDFVTGLSGGKQPGPETVEDATPGAAEELLAALNRNEPALVVDTSTSDLRGSGAYPLTDFPELHEFLLANYHKAQVVDGVTIWRRDATNRPR